MEAERLLLIVEDDAAFARTLGRSFERRGYTVLLAANVDEVASLLLATVRNHGWREEAIERGRHGERIALIDREAELEQALKPRVAGLRTKLIEITRPVEAG